MTFFFFFLLFVATAVRKENNKSTSRMCLPKTLESVYRRWSFPLQSYLFFLYFLPLYFCLLNMFCRQFGAVYINMPINIRHPLEITSFPTFNTLGLWLFNIIIDCVLVGIANNNSFFLSFCQYPVYTDNKKEARELERWEWEDNLKIISFSFSWRQEILDEHSQRNTAQSRGDCTVLI